MRTNILSCRRFTLISSVRIQPVVSLLAGRVLLSLWLPRAIIGHSAVIEGKGIGSCETMR